MAKMAFQHQAGTAMECLSVSSTGFPRKQICFYCVRNQFLSWPVMTFLFSDSHYVAQGERL